MNMLYAIFIKPFELLLSGLFSVSNALTHNYGISLILLSVFVSALMFPLFYLAELWKRKEQLLQNKMKVKIDSIKKYYASSKRHYLIAETHKLYGYKSIYAFRTSIGLLIQIPVFLAAYNLLSKYDGFAGVPFLFIKDLAKPDGLLFGIHFLPILMTIVNIASSLQYVKMTSAANVRGNLKETAQLGIFALVFLLLLYNSPAALVVYWTGNNILSIPKNFIFARMKSLKLLLPAKSEVPVRPVKTAFTILPAVAKLAKVFYVSATWAAVYGIFLAILRIYLYIEANLKINVTIELVFLLGSVPVFLYAVKNFFTQDIPFSSAVKKSCVLICIYMIPVILSAYILLKGHMGTFGIPQILLYAFFVFANAAVLLYVNGKKQTNDFLTRFFSGTETSYMLLSVVLTALLFFFYYPSTIYASDSSYFSQTLLQIQLKMLIPCLLYLATMLLIYHLINRYLKKGLAFISFVVLLCALSNIFLFSGNYGSLDLNFLSNSDFSNSVQAFMLDILCVFFIIAFCLFLYHFSCTKQLLLVLKICIASVCFITFFNTISVQMDYLKKKSGKKHGDSEVEKFYALNPNEKNVVLLIFDMFTGGHMQELLERNPDFIEKLSGFVWYPDTVANAYTTIAGLPPIYGGMDYTAEAINKRNGKPHTEINLSYTKLPNLFARQGYSVELNKPSDFLENTFSKNLEKPESVFLFDPQQVSSFVLEILDTKNQTIDYGSFFMTVSLFKSIPHFLRAYVYSNATWLGTVKNVSAFDVTARQVALLKMLSAKTSFTNKEPSLKIIYSLLSHMPWYLAENDLKLVADPYPATEGEYITVNGVLPEHLFSEEHIIRFLCDYISLLKQNGAYDNTRIIAVSDHCDADSAMLNRALGGKVSGTSALEAENKYPGRPHSLLLFKDFNAKGDLVISDKFMTAADAYYLTKKI